MKNFSILRVIGVLLIVLSIPLAISLYFLSSLCGFDPNPVANCSTRYVPMLIPAFMFIVGVIILRSKRMKK